MRATIHERSGEDNAPARPEPPNGFAFGSIRCQTGHVHSPVIISAQQRHSDTGCLVCAVARLREALAHLAAVVALVRPELPRHAAERAMNDIGEDLDDARSRIGCALAILEDVE